MTTKVGLIREFSPVASSSAGPEPVQLLSQNGRAAEEIAMRNRRGGRRRKGRRH